MARTRTEKRMRYLRFFNTFPTAHHRLLLQIVIMQPLIRGGVHLFGFKTTYAILAWVADTWSQPAPADETNEVKRIRRSVRYAKRKLPPVGNCLSYSLVVWWLLRRQQIDCQLRIGVRQQAGEFQAHAWVEYRGESVNAGVKVRQKYTTFDHVFVPETLEFVRN